MKTLNLYQWQFECFDCASRSTPATPPKRGDFTLVKWLVSGERGVRSAECGEGM
ncbi:hypothetical protein [Chamaesiphon sp. VAR_48_metabat_403]|uniref:hypothetical protein n=1 Tax=Chamaesiphon sp. VAR_48_metabat_403 TaxID=2964700 RepID=UPI00286E2ECB|nr:hypothetical protein [Chamaesiphon sp. VAR_48_metabat_403]